MFDISGILMEMEARGWTKRDLAKKLDVTESVITRLERQNKFTLTLLEKMCRLFGCSISSLVVHRNKTFEESDIIPFPMKSARIPEEIKKQIRAEYVYGVIGFGHLAKKFNISETSVVKILKNEPSET